MSDEPTFILNSGPQHGPLDHDLHGPLSASSNSYNATFTNSSKNNNTISTHNAAMNGQQAAMALQIKKLSPNAKAPTRGSKFAAGYDIYAAETMIVPGRGKAMVGTGIAIAVPVGTCELGLILLVSLLRLFLFCA